MMRHQTGTDTQKVRVLLDFSRLPVSSEPAPMLDHRLLVAAAAVRQAATRTARLAGEADGNAAAPEPLNALVVTFGAVGGDRPAAARALSGSFHPGVAMAQHGVVPSISMKRRFTLAF